MPGTPATNAQVDLIGAETETETEASVPQCQVDFDRPLVSILGLPFDAIDVAQAVRRIRAAAFAGRRCFLSTPNLNFAMAARNDAAIRGSVLHRIFKLNRWRVPSLDRLASWSAAERTLTRHLEIKLRRALEKELR